MEDSGNLRQRGIHRKNTVGRSGEILDSTLPSGKGEQSANMAGSTRIIRYVLFAFFVSGLPVLEVIRTNNSQGIMVIYFISSSSTIPTAPLERWKGNKDKDSPATELSPPGPPSAEEKILAPPPSMAAPAEPLSSNNTLSLGTGRMNATFVTLARNSDLWDIADSIRNVEDRFNRNYHYDWVFLNDKEFDDNFIKVTTALVSGTTHYGTIPKEHWSFPDFIDQDKAKKVREDMAERKIIYGDSVSYRHMCRFESGFFFRQPLMQNYEWYWRVEPSIKLYCDISFDPFRVMAENKKKYSFVISLYEYAETIPTIWDSAKKFMEKFPEHIPEGNSMRWLSDDDGKTYNHCHFVGALLRQSYLHEANACFSGPISKSEI